MGFPPEPPLDIRGLDPDPMVGLLARPGFEPESGFGGITGLAAAVGLTPREEGFVKPGTLTGPGNPSFLGPLTLGLAGIWTVGLAGRLAVDCRGCLLVILVICNTVRECKF